MEKVYIVAARRTPIGTFQGAFSNIPAPKLGAAAIQAALADSGLSPQSIDECIMGNVLTAGLGQAPARQAALYAGLPQSVECMTINKVCGSGLKAAMLAADSIALGHAHAIVAGGQENMTLAPHLLEKSRAGYRMGPVQVTDSMIKDGLWDPYNDYHMGSCAELCVKEYAFTREAQDAFAIESYKRAQNAQTKGWFKTEIVKVDAPSGRETVSVELDEEPTKAKLDKIASLRPAFDKAGTITAANASKINDGGAALILVSETKMKEAGLKPLARIVSHASFAHDPKWFTTAPVGAIKKALARGAMNVKDIDLFEINEAFAAVTMVAVKDLNLSPDRVNIHGGAVALGHPIGASGARVLTTLVHALQTHQLKKGLATLCIGGGEGAAMIVERV